MGCQASISNLPVLGCCGSGVPYRWCYAKVIIPGVVHVLNKWDIDDNWGGVSGTLTGDAKLYRQIERTFKIRKTATGGEFLDEWDEWTETAYHEEDGSITITGRPAASTVAAAIERWRSWSTYTPPSGYHVTSTATSFSLQFLGTFGESGSGRTGWDVEHSFALQSPEDLSVRIPNIVSAWNTLTSWGASSPSWNATSGRYMPEEFHYHWDTSTFASGPSGTAAWDGSYPDANTAALKYPKYCGNGYSSIFGGWYWWHVHASSPDIYEEYNENYSLHLYRLSGIAHDRPVGESSDPKSPQIDPYICIKHGLEAGSSLESPVATTAGFSLSAPSVAPPTGFEDAGFPAEYYHYNYRSFWHTPYDSAWGEAQPGGCDFTP